MGTLAPIQLRRMPAVSWSGQNIVLRAGEPGYAVDTHVLKIGDGGTPWNDLPPFATVADVADLEETVNQLLAEITVANDAIADTAQDIYDDNAATLAAIIADNDETAAATSADASTATAAAADALASANIASAGQFFGQLQTVAIDFNTIVLPGVYRFGSAIATASPNSPTTMAGVLEVFNITGLGSAPIQRYTPYGTSARGIWIRWMGSGTWNAWRFLASQRIDNPAGQPGVGVYTWDDSNNREQGLFPTGLNLGTNDLNIISVPGLYQQGTSATATPALNYPIASAGALTVTTAGSAWIVQDYTTAGGNNASFPRKFVRKGTFAAGVWSFSAWVHIPSQRVDQTAGRAIYTWDDLNSREQLIYGDTGWREITLDNGWTGSVRARRVGNAVDVVGRDLNGTAASSINVLTIGTGFRPQQNIPVVGRPPSISAVPIYGSVTNGSGVLQANVGSIFHTASFQFSFTTLDTWPTSLPGTPVGVIPT